MSNVTTNCNCLCYNRTVLIPSVILDEVSNRNIPEKNTIWEQEMNIYAINWQNAD